MLALFFHVAVIWDEASRDIVQNTKIGIAAATGVLMYVGLVMFPDGPFVRPHPAMWRLVMAGSVVYQLYLVFFLYQNVGDARDLLKYWDDSLGVPLPEKSYAENCDLTWENVMSQVDEFVIAHALGWMGKAIMLRSYGMCWTISIMFEVLEYSLQHQLPNFAECWWDHWILDVLLCNWIGLEVGLRLCRMLEMKTYSWTHMKHIRTYSGKMRRVAQQFTPHNWTKFDWEATRSWTHFLTVIVVIVVFLQGELNAFYLKYLLWIPSSHPFNAIRLAFMFLTGTAAVREAYQYVTDPLSARMGSQLWLTIANVMTESLICFKYGKNEFKAPTPLPVVYFWSVFITLIVGYAAWKFVYLPWRVGRPIGKTVSSTLALKQE